jgi:hypothetical protein
MPVYGVFSVDPLDWHSSLRDTPMALRTCVVTLALALSMLSCKLSVGAIDGRAAQVERRAAQVEGRAAQVEGRAAQVEGRAAQVEGRAAQVEGRAAQVEGRAAQVEGRAAQVEGRAAQVEGRAAQVGARGAPNRQAATDLIEEPYTDNDHEYEIGFYRVGNSRHYLRFFVAMLKPRNPDQFVKNAYDIEDLDLMGKAANAGRGVFEGGITLTNPGLFKTVKINKGETLIMGVYSNDARYTKWFAVGRMSESTDFQVWKGGNGHTTAIPGQTETLIGQSAIGQSTWFRVYFLIDGRVRFAFLPDNAADFHSFRLVGKYSEGPIKVADEQYSYYAVKVKGDFNWATATEAADMGRDAVQRFGVTLANPCDPQKPIKLASADEYLVIVAYNSARNKFVSFPVIIGASGNLLTLTDPSGRPDVLFPLTEKELGGFQIPVSVVAGPGLELNYSVGFPH